MHSPLLVEIPVSPKIYRSLKFDCSYISLRPSKMFLLGSMANRKFNFPISCWRQLSGRDKKLELVTRQFFPDFWQKKELNEKWQSRRKGYHIFFLFSRNSFWAQKFKTSLHFGVGFRKHRIFILGRFFPWNIWQSWVPKVERHALRRKWATHTKSPPPKLHSKCTFSTGRNHAEKKKSKEDASLHNIFFL